MSGGALVQDWFHTPGGAERVALELDRLLDQPDVYASFADEPTVRRLGHRLHAWPLQRLFPGTHAYRRFLPLYPLWFGRLDLTRYGLVVSSSSAFAKAARTRPGATHIAYIHTPMRYAWDLADYLQGSSFSLPSRVGARTIRPWLRSWDVRTSKRPTALVANSETVRQRIAAFWGRDAEVIHPPVDVDEIELGATDDGYLLVAARMLAYRRVDLAVTAATTLRRDLVVVGDGPEARRLRALAGPTVRFLGAVDRASLIALFRRAHAYVVPGVEDFGIAPVEAMAAGKPVIAFRGGGARETVVDGTTGVFFDRPTGDDLVAAIERLDAMAFDPAKIRANAERFAASVFRAKFVDLFRRLGVDPSLYSDA